MARLLGEVEDDEEDDNELIEMEEDYRRKLWGSQFILPAGKGTACMHAYACLWDPSLLLTAPCLLPLRAAPGADPNADVSPQLIRMRGWLLRIVRAMEL